MKNPNKQVANLMMHVQEEKLDAALRILRKLQKPAIRKIAGEDCYVLSARCDSIEARDLIPKLKRAGCEGIVQSPVVKLLP